MRATFSRMILLVGLASTAARAQESIPIETMTAIKDATVMITTAVEADPDSAISGSGFLIRVEGRDGYVVTNDHVIRLAGGRPASTVIFRGGTRGERKATARVVAASAERDLAILKVTDVPDLPGPIDIRNVPEPVETMPVYVFGFPFGSALARGRGKPSVVVGKGSVSSLRRDTDSKAIAVLIDGALNPGNSGGPVVDAKGRLVGVAVATVRGANIGIAIAPAELLTMLDGKPEGLEVAVKAARNATAELAIEVPLIDPLGRIKAVTLHSETDGSGKRANEAELKVEARRARGAVTVPTLARDLDVSYQVAYTDGQGRVLRTRPGHYFVVSARPDGSGLAPWGDLIDPDGDCKVRVENGGVSFEVPGSLHDLSAEIGKVNSPRILRDVEGDFVAQVKVCGDFRPEGPATREGSYPYHGAGLLLWLDADHYIRLERGAIERNKRVGTFLLFESRELGRRNLRNNAILEPCDVHLRLERRGNRISGALSTDGRQWAEARPMDIDWPSRLKVGFAAVSSAFSPLSVRFEEFSIRKPGPEDSR